LEIRSRLQAAARHKARAVPAPARCQPPPFR
jgi:hypothetical protein